MSLEKRTAVNVSFDGCSWQAEDSEANSMPLSVDAGDMLPELPEGYLAKTLIVPAEMLLNRTFSLPLSNPRYIDAEILAQELDEQTGEESDIWWLSWQAACDGDQVRGMLFGLSEAFRSAIDSSDQWQQIQFVGVDMQMRLAAHLGQDSETGEGLIALFDADSSGLVFGLCRRSENAQPIWLGMRRLNYDSADETVLSQVATEIRHTLVAMGWSADTELAATGVLASNLQDALALPQWRGESLDVSELSGRHATALSANCSEALNFRHGRWRARSASGEGLKPWYRTMALAAACLLVWTIGMLWQNAQIDRQNEHLQSSINFAFHRGLPNETVIIDPLAQLRKAAGSSSGGSTESDTVKILNHIAAINRVFTSNPWEMSELSYSDGGMQIAGAASDLAAMNRIQLLLQMELGTNVSLKDSDLSGTQVKFRVVW